MKDFVTLLKNSSRETISLMIKRIKTEIYYKEYELRDLQHELNFLINLLKDDKF